MQELRLNLDCDLKVVKIIVFFGPCTISFYSFYVISLEETDVKPNPGHFPWDCGPTLRTSDKTTELNYFKQFETDEKKDLIINETKPEQETLN